MSTQQHDYGTDSPYLNTTTTKKGNYMTNLITHKRKNNMFVWEIIELFMTDTESKHPYAVKASGDNGAFYYGEHHTIDEALEAIQELRDEVKS